MDYLLKILTALIIIIGSYKNGNTIDSEKQAIQAIITKRIVDLDREMSRVPFLPQIRCNYPFIQNIFKLKYFALPSQELYYDIIVNSNIDFAPS